MALLDLEEVTVRFGGKIAVDGVEFSAEAGHVTALIGPNGAGKTTLFNVITGLQPPTRGRVVLDGKDLSGRPPHKRARDGIARTFQRLELFRVLSARENVLVGAEVRKSWSRDKFDTHAEVQRLLDLVGLTDVADQRVDALPTGQARLVELARALATQPRLLLLDEPASGLDESETGQFGELLRELAAGGMAVLLVEHDVSLVMAASDNVHVLDFGRIIASGPPEEIRTNQAVLEAYLGTTATKEAG